MTAATPKCRSSTRCACPRACPGARLIKTYGLGHYRLLRDPGVVRAIVDFVRGDVDDLPAELPVLPRPAPIY